MKLYGHPGSTCTRKVLTVFAEKGVKPDFNLVDLGKGAHKAPEHLARQPFGQVPALDDDGFQLYESRAICRYLDATLSGPKLTPADAKGAAIMEQWISIEHSHFSPMAMKIVYQKVFHPMRGLPSDEAVVEEGKKGLERSLPVMEKQLAQNAFLAGDTFTLADIMFMPYIEYLYVGKAAEQIERHERVHAWWKKVSERPSWAIATGKA
jgi:glutathione S-transferase